MERVLLLNQSYEPISIINWKKAITLLITEKIEVVEEYNLNIRSRFMTIKLPSVVRLLKNFKKPKKKVKFNKSNIIARDHWKCQYCGNIFQPNELTYDHVIPKSRGGKTSWDNIVTCCNECNTKKGNMMPHEAGMRLKRIPTKPDWVPIFIFSLSKEKIPENWKNFCFFS